ncbi:hypothetical protein LXL04_036534 [Taraxacum kok-saghyz]
MKSLPLKRASGLERVLLETPAEGGRSRRCAGGASGQKVSLETPEIRGRSRRSQNDAAEKRRSTGASKVEPKDAEALSKYSNFFWEIRKDLWAAEQNLLEAISIDPVNSFYTATHVAVVKIVAVGGGSGGDEDERGGGDTRFRFYWRDKCLKEDENEAVQLL